MKELFAKLKSFMGFTAPPIKQGPEKEMAHNILANCEVIQKALQKPFNTSALLIYNAFHRTTIRTCIADIMFAIHQIEDIGYVTRVIASSMTSIQVEEGLTLYEFSPNGPRDVAEYVNVLSRLALVYQNMLDVDTKESNHTVMLLTNYLAVHQKVLANYVKCF